MRRESYSNDNNANSNNQQVKLEDYLEDDEAESSDSDEEPILGRQRRNSMENNHNHNHNDNSLHRAKSYGSEPYDENAEFRAGDGSVSMAASDLASSTGPAHPGECRSRLLLESPEYQGVWELYPETHLQEFSIYVYKYLLIEPLINNAQQLVRLVDGCKRC